MSLRRLADELAGSVETLAPRVHESLKRVAPKRIRKTPRGKPSRTPSGKHGWLPGAAIVAATAGIAVWLSFRPADDKPAPSVKGGADQRSRTPTRTPPQQKPRPEANLIPGRPTGRRMGPGNSAPVMFVRRLPVSASWSAGPPWEQRP